jgi:hypothetical protein
MIEKDFVTRDLKEPNRRIPGKRTGTEQVTVEWKYRSHPWVP